MTINPYFRWYDLWVGLYWDRKQRILYIGYFPMLGIRIVFRPKRVITGMLHGTANLTVEDAQDFQRR